MDFDKLYLVIVFAPMARDRSSYLFSDYYISESKFHGIVTYAKPMNNNHLLFICLDANTSLKTCFNIINKMKRIAYADKLGLPANTAYDIVNQAISAAKQE